MSPANPLRMTTNWGPLAPRRRKHTRLDQALYAEPGAICSVTAATLHRRPVFADPALARSAVTVLHERASIMAVPVYVYCVMPDHVHLALGPSASCDIITFVGQFKNLAQRAAWALGVSGRIWQTGFYDHFLRREEHLEDVVEYVLGNPVRAGLVAAPTDYEFSGSLVFDLKP